MICSTRSCSHQNWSQALYRIVRASQADPLDYPDEAARPLKVKTLLTVCIHYNKIIEEHMKNSKTRHLTSEQVAAIIEQGYDSIQLGQHSDRKERYLESEERTFLRLLMREVNADLAHHLAL